MMNDDGITVRVKQRGASNKQFPPNSTTTSKVLDFGFDFIAAR
jgi:hypothetical protein